MTNYLNNFKWIITGQEEMKLNPKSSEKFELINGLNIGDNLGEIYKEYDFGPDNLAISPKKLNGDIKEIINEYNTIHLEMVEKEQLVRERLDSDTIDKIKSNYHNYINDDIKIIKDFAIIMETFSHIQKKLSEFELGIKEFESVKLKTLNQDLNNQEFEIKIKLIDEKLYNTIKFIDEIKLTNDILMNKIIKLENIIKKNDDKGQEILSKLEKINIFDNENKNKKEKKLINKYNYFQISKYNFMLITFLTGTCVIGTYFGIKFILKRK